MTSVLSDEMKKTIFKVTKTTAAKPDKVADFVAFLASEDSDLINGQTFIVEATQMKKEERLHFKNHT